MVIQGIAVVLKKVTMAIFFVFFTNLILFFVPISTAYSDPVQNQPTQSTKTEIDKDLEQNDVYMSTSSNESNGTVQSSQATKVNLDNAPAVAVESDIANNKGNVGLDVKKKTNDVVDKSANESQSRLKKANAVRHQVRKNNTKANFSTGSFDSNIISNMIVSGYQDDRIIAAISKANLHNLSSLTKSGSNLLSVAVAKKKINVVRALLSKKFPVNNRDMAGATALHAALRSDNVDILNELILAGADANIADKTGYTPLVRSAMSCNEYFVDKIINDSIVMIGASNIDKAISFARNCSNRDSLVAILRKKN